MVRLRQQGGLQRPLPGGRVVTYTIEDQQSRARLLRAQGHSYISIHRRLNVDLTTLRRWLDPRFDLKESEDFRGNCD